MKEGWEYSTIGELCDKKNGLWKGKTGPFVNVGVIRNANFTKSFTLSFDNIEYLDVEVKQYKTRKLEKGDLIVEKSGGSEKQPVGRTVLFEKEDGEYSFSNFTSVLRIKDRDIISPEFLYKYILYIYLRGDTRKMQKATTGIHNIEFDKFLAIPVPTLSLSEQQSIVDYLDSAFAKIDAMKANAEKALNEAKALFQASLKEMLEPKEGWEEKYLKDIAEYSIGLTYKPTDVCDDGTIVLRSSNIQEGKLDLNDIVRVNTSIKEKLYVQCGDILMCSRNGSARLVGKVCIIPELKEKMTYGTFMMVIRSAYNPLLYHYFDTELFKRQIKHGEANMINQITRYMLDEVKLNLPPIKEQQTIVSTLDSLKSKVDRLQANYEKISQECDALKQAILRQVFE